MFLFLLVWVGMSSPGFNCNLEYYLHVYIARFEALQIIHVTFYSMAYEVSRYTSGMYPVAI